MPKKKIQSAGSKQKMNGGPLGFEAKLWAAADALRNNMDAAEYKHVVLGLIYLKYISDVFEAKHAKLVAQKEQCADPEDPDEYRAVNIFWVPKEARWQHLNPPFNNSDWRGELLKDDQRWAYGTPPVGNANCVWVQHFVHHLTPIVLANGSMSPNQSGEGEIPSVARHGRLAHA